MQHSVSPPVLKSISQCQDQPTGKKGSLPRKLRLNRHHLTSLRPSTPITGVDRQTENHPSLPSDVHSLPAFICRESTGSNLIMLPVYVSHPQVMLSTSPSLSPSLTANNSWKPSSVPSVIHGVPSAKSPSSSVRSLTGPSPFVPVETSPPLRTRSRLQSSQGVAVLCPFLSSCHWA